jgi:hypothetical protein
MKTSIIKLIESLKDRVVSNLQSVKLNEKIIKEMLSKPDSSERNFLLEVKFNENRRLLAENLDFIEIRSKLTNLLEKYKNAEFLKEDEVSKNEKENISIEDYFLVTIEGELEFNENHPYFHDDDFFAKLINYYSGKENYEKCQELMKIKNKKSCNV